MSKNEIEKVRDEIVIRFFFSFFPSLWCVCSGGICGREYCLE